MQKKWFRLKQVIDEKRKELSPTPLTTAVPLDETHLFFENQKILNFCSPDYLGLSFHPTLQKNAIKFILQHGHSSTHSSINLQTHIEERLAETLGIEAAALLPSRFQAHTAILPTLATSQSLILMDRSAHFSLKQAATISHASIESFTHNDLNHLKMLLEETRNLSYFTKIIVTESVFSIEGDRAPIDELIELAQSYDALLYVDDTHALGALGKKGMGLTAHRKEIDMRIGAFDCGCGASLAFAGGSFLIIDYLQALCPALKENPLPLPALGVIEAILDLLPELEGERKVLQQRAYYLTTQLQNLGFETGSSTTHLIPLILDSNARVLDTYNTLLEHKILTKPLFIPDVAQNQARLLLSLNIHHTPEHLSYLLNHLSEGKKIAQELPCAILT